MEIEFYKPTIRGPANEYRKFAFLREDLLFKYPYYTRADMWSSA